jgi:hypothetical protein
MATYLNIFIDTTGSMGSWIATLNKIIPQFIRISGLTGAFKKICVVSYKDYDQIDQIDPVSSTGWLDPSDPLLITFSKNLSATGGGGAPEAVKTGLYKVLKELPEGLDCSNDRIYLLHLTDAVAHEGSTGRLDNEGTKELKVLGPERFDWVELTSQILMKPIVYNCYSTCNFNLYASLAASTGGFYIPANINQLDTGILSIFNGWFDAQPDLTFQNKELQIKTRGKKTVEGEVDLMKHYNLVEVSKSIAQPELALALASVLTRLDTDETFRSYVFKLLGDIIQDDVLTLTSNKIFGKVWRKICCYRKDPKRDELIQLIERVKKSLDPTKRTKFDAWLKESYNMIEEIKGELDDLVNEEKVSLNGTIEFYRDHGDNSEPADMVGMLRALGSPDQSYIKNIFARLSVNPDKRFDLTNPNNLPLSISPARIFSLVLHLAAPGTKFNGRRNQAILAMLALGTVLDSQAREFLIKYKGKWLNWALDADNKPEIPENFQVKFLYLCKGCDSSHEYFTQEELDKINRLTKLTLCNRIPEMNIEASYEILNGMDGVRPDHHVICTKCTNPRPISLLTPELTCGYCWYGVKPRVEPKPETTFMVRCSGCKGFYSRDKGMHIMGKSLCHECDNGLSPSTQTCTTCKYKFVCRSGTGLPRGICKLCELGRPKLNPSYKSSKLTVRQLLEETPNGLEVANSLIGFSYTKGVNNLIQMDRTFADVPVPDLDQVKQMEIIWNNKLISNWSEIVEQIANVITSHYIERACCDLCCEPKPNSELGPACGRSGCDQVLCGDCGSNWYGTNKLGHVVNVRHCQCMFCSRQPGPKTVRRWWNPDAMALTRPGGIPPMDPAYYYAWCVRCRLIKPCGERACGAGQAPRLENFECEDCETARLAFEAEQRAAAARPGHGHGLGQPTNPAYEQEVKSCPSCDQPTIRYAGCNHITCPCGAHWCYECGGEFAYGEIYSHMNRVHGRIYSYETPYFEDNGYDSDY